MSFPAEHNAAHLIIHTLLQVLQKKTHIHYVGLMLLDKEIKHSKLVNQVVQILDMTHWSIFSTTACQRCVFGFSYSGVWCTLTFCSLPKVSMTHAFKPFTLFIKLQSKIYLLFFFSISYPEFLPACLLLSLSLALFCTNNHPFRFLASFFHPHFSFLSCYSPFHIVR